MTSKSLKQLPTLDGLRAIAIILVLLYHLTPGKNADKGLQSIIFKVSEFGWSGVDLFFVLSGFLITDLVRKLKNEEETMRRFYRNRFLRIVPVYILALISVFYVIPLLTNSYQVPKTTDQLIYYFYIQNYFPLKIIDNEYVLLGHFWSIAVEMQFYILWPVVIYNFRSVTIVKIALYLILVFAFIRSGLIFNHTDWGVTFSWTPFRIDGLLLGSVASVWMASGRIAPSLLNRLWLITAVLAIIVAWFIWTGKATEMVKMGTWLENKIIRSTVPSIVSIFFTFILILSLHNNQLTSFLSLRLWKPIARYSYGIYVIHYMLIPTFYSTLYRVLESFQLLSSEMVIYAYFLSCSVISFVLAFISYHFYEIHFLKLKHPN